VTGFVALRIAAALPVLFALAVLTFILQEAAPGDPAISAAQAASGGGFPRRELVERYRAEFHLDDPAIERFGRWLGGVAQGDFGDSLRTRRPVRDTVAEALPRTVILSGSGLLVAWLLAVVSGAWSGFHPRNPGTLAMNGLIAVLIGTPAFATALIALWLGGVELGWFPLGGITDAGADETVGQVARHAALPTMVLALSYFGWYARTIQVCVADVLQTEYITVARAKGLRTMVIARRHVLRLALIPFVTQAGASFGAVVSGAYAVEVVFSWPGLGRELVLSAQARDYPMVMGLVLVTGALVIAGNVVADVLVARLDPRVKLGFGK
jgi:ABC-type dipeptide/oligopeptide/nickel transport system permease component